MLSSGEIQALLTKIPAGYLNPNDEFFRPANETFLIAYKKLGVLSTDDDNIESLSTDSNVNDKSSKLQHNNEIYCNVPKCGRYFANVAAYQSHCNSMHRYICVQCNKSLPTPHLLDLHIEEQHDSYFATRLERGEPMYVCLLEECKERWLTTAQRKEHCIRVHKFPNNFRFDQIYTLSSKGDKKSKTADAMDTTDVEAQQKASGNHNNAKSKKSNYFTFGHQNSKTFISYRRSAKERKATTDGATLENMKCLEEALSEQ